MDYKAVIEGQIEKLQEVQNKIVSEANVMNANECCRVAETISSLCFSATTLKQRGND